MESPATKKNEWQPARPMERIRLFERFVGPHRARERIARCEPYDDAGSYGPRVIGRAFGWGVESIVNVFLDYLNLP